MTMSTTENSGSQSDPIEEALKHTRQVAGEIQDTADELGVVHAVLDKKLAETQDEDLNNAVARTQELEQRLMETVETLETANELLERQTAPTNKPAGQLGAH